MSLIAAPFDVRVTLIAGFSMTVVTSGITGATGSVWLIAVGVEAEVKEGGAFIDVAEGVVGVVVADGGLGGGVV